MGNIIKSSISIASKAESHVNIPEEIIVQILSRLPLGSLPQFTCISKQWHSLISNIIVAKTGSPRVLLISDSRAYSFSPHSIHQNQQHEVDVNSIHVPWKLSESGDHEFKILGSCNGLVLMHIDDDLFLWNPLTRFFKKVLASDRVCDRGRTTYRVCSGLCYDSTSDEYKAVLVNSSLTPGYGDESVAVGSFRSKSWTTIAFPYYVPLWDSWNIIVNGNLHWFASKNDSGTGGYFLSPRQIIYLRNATLTTFFYNMFTTW
ncbi:F-box/kelch-repeat protein At3g23880-like [Rhododendron vialii]|uniref:F-box/kelch-repeat protein At3g23880-like n=1 Tax=Rhododendron vialii TaxID=182163 RepID=UPI00265E254A|nr:F-box/kelch-repeat protein At3g23880-like [Rhododendron vialii]